MHFSVNKCAMFKWLNTYLKKGEIETNMEKRTSFKQDGCGISEDFT